MEMLGNKSVYAWKNILWDGWALGNTQRSRDSIEVHKIIQQMEKLCLTILDARLDQAKQFNIDRK